MRRRPFVSWLLGGGGIALAVALLVPAEGREAASRLRAFFSPGGGATKALSGRIRGAQRTLDVAVYIFSAPSLATDVIAAHKRGVRVRVVVDGRMSGRWSQAGELEAHGVPLWRIHLDRRPEDATDPQFHHKFAVVDGEIVVTGSFNWTVMAEESNHENMLVIEDRALASRFTRAFERALGLASGGPAD